MKIKTVITAYLISLAITVQAGEERFDIRKEITSSDFKAQFETEVSLFLSGDKTPKFPEVGRPETYTAVSISLSPFGGSRRHCLDAFQKAVKSMIDTAISHGYDAIFEIKQAESESPKNEPGILKCEPGYKVTTVSISGTMALSASALQRKLDEEHIFINLPSRAPATGAIFIAMDQIFESPEARKILAHGLSAHWGKTSPEFKHRSGPDDYSDEAEITASGAENACRSATLKALSQIANEAKERNFNAIIKLRSHWEGEYVQPGTLECLVGKKKAYVTLQATLAEIN